MDAAQQIIEFLFERMQIDDDWAVKQPGRFEWWAGPLAQRIWATPPRDVQGVTVTTIHIETDLLREVPSTAEVFTRLAGLNRLCSLSAYVANTDTGKVQLHASVSVTEDNWPLARALALHAMALQVADAHMEAEPLAGVFGAAVDATAHPDTGRRKDLDEMLGVLSIYEERGEGGSPFTTEEFAGLVHLEPRPWKTASSSRAGLEAELEFRTGSPVSRLTLDGAFRHPALGAGLLIRLALPVEPDPTIVQKLNAAERVLPDGHQLGGWAVDEEQELVCSVFIPAAAHVPNLMRALVYHMSARNDWAAELLFPSA
ncbi:MAG: hypothetical protein AB7O67_10045 [Vicinamibacterales bacterium]